LTVNIGSLPFHQFIDNQDPGYAETGGNWQSWTDSNAYAGNFRYHAGGDGSDGAAAQFSFGSLDPTKTYQVFVTWTAQSNRASNSPFTVLDGTTPLATVLINQQFAPADATGDGTTWESLGTYQASTGTLNVELGDAANGYVIANAACVATVPAVTTAPSVLDTGDASYKEGGSGWLGYSEAGAYDGDFRYHAPGDGSDTATWTFQALDPTRAYQVYATWSAQSNRATNSPFTVLNGSTSLATVRLNQQFAPSDTTIDGQGWESLGIYTPTSGSLAVQLGDNADGDVVADAIRLVEIQPPAAPPSVISTGDAAYAEAGNNWLGYSEAAAYGGSFRYHMPGDGSDTASYSFQGLDPTEQYQVYATWSAQSNRADNSPFTVLNGSTALATVRLNQQFAPSDATMDGYGWESLGVYTPTSGTLAVQLSDDADGDVVADAIRVVEVPPVVTPPSVIDTGDAAYQEGGSNWLGYSEAAAYQGSFRYHAPGDGSDTATWTASALLPGVYQVYTTWSAAGNRADNSPFTVLDGSTSLATVRVNQQVAPSDTTIDGQGWESLGQYTVDSGSLAVQLSDNADGIVAANAIRVTYVAPLVLYWDPDGSAVGNVVATGAGLGGSGAWTAGSGNDWYNPATGQDGAWINGAQAVFEGAAGTVSISGQVSASTITFASNAYTLTSGTLLVPTYAGTTVDVTGGMATIGSTIAGPGQLTTTDAGTLVLSGANTYSGGTTVVSGSVTADIDSLGSGGLNVAAGATLTVQPGVSSASSGGIIAANFDPFGGNNISGTYGVVPTAGWNNDLQGWWYSTWNNLQDSTGQTTNVQVTDWDNADGGHSGWYGWNTGSTDPLLDWCLGGGALGGGDPYLAMTINNIPYAQYKIIDYANNVWGGNCQVWLAGGGPTYYYTPTGAIGGDIDNSYLQVTNTTAANYPASNYVEFDNLTGPSQTFYNESTNGNGMINGFEIVDTTPSLVSTGTFASLSGAGNLVLAGSDGTNVTLTVGSDNTSTTFSGTISGTGSLVKTGSGTLTLSGTNTYTGSTTVTGGAIQVGSGAGTGTLGTGAVVDNGSLVFDRSDTLTVANAIGGSGSLAQSGEGTLVLAGAISYTGATTVNIGTLEGTVASIPGNVNLASPSANVTFDQSGLGVYSGVVSGSGSFTKTGSGTLIVAAPQTYTGATVIGDGTLKLATSAISGFGGSGAGWTTNGGPAIAGDVLTLTDNQYQEARSAFDNTEVPTGPFTARFVYQATGDAAADGAALVFQNDARGASSLGGPGSNLGYNGIAQSAAVEFNLLTLGSSVVPGTNYATGGATGGYAATGPVNLRSGDPIQVNLTYDGSTLTETLTDLSNSNTWSTSYSGVDLAAITGGSTAYIGFTGGTGGLESTQTISNFTFVAMGGSNLLPTGTALQIAGGASLDLNGFQQTVGSLADATPGATSGEQVLLSGGTLTVGGDNTSTIFSGTISGSGNLTKTGSGTLTLGGANTYSGQTAIEQGVIRVAATGALQQSTVNMSTSGSLVFSPGISSVSIGGLAGAVDLALENSAGAPVALSVGGNGASSTYSGVLSGPGSLAMAGSGTLTLTGTDTYTGGTAVSAGTLALDAADGPAIAGDLVVSGGTAQLLADGQAPANSSVNVSGGTLDLGANDLSLAGVHLTGGSIIGTTGVLTSTATFDLEAGTVSAVLDGSQGVAKTGSGAVTLSGTNTYSGGTTISGGTLAFYSLANLGTDGITFDGGTLQYAAGNTADISARTVIIDSSDCTIDTGSNTVTFASPVGNGGSGGLAKLGTGTLVLTAANAYTGDTTISTGTLQLGDGTANDGSVAGNIIDNAALVFANPASQTFAGVISGSGSVTKTGGGTLTLSGQNTYAGETVIAGGTLALGVDNALPTTGVVRIGDAAFGSGVLDVSAHDQAIAGLYTDPASSQLSLGQDEVTNSGGAAKLTVNNAHDYVFKGFFSGSLSIDKYGAGEWTLGGENTNSGDVAVYNGTLNVTGGLSCNVYTVPGTGNPEVSGNTDPYYWVVTTSMEMGDQTYSYTPEPDLRVLPQYDTSKGGQPVLVTGDWEEAVITAVSGTIYVNNTQTAYSFGGDSTSGAFLVGTVADLAAEVNGSGPDKFLLDEPSYMAAYGLTADTKLIVMEDEYGWPWCDSDYNDVFWVVQTQELPQASISGPTSGPEGSQVDLTGSATDPAASGTPNFTYNWSVTKNGNAFPYNTTNSGANLYFTPDDKGIYVATLTVSDANGTSPPVSQTVTVNNVPPTVTIDGAASVAEGSAYTLNLSSTAPACDPITSYSVDWGDDTEPTTGSGVPPASLGHVYNETPEGGGSFTITATVYESAGDSGSTTCNVTVNSLSTSGIPNVGVNENGSPCVLLLPNYFADTGQASSALAYSVIGNTNPSLFSSVTTNSSGNVTLTFAQNTCGDSVLSVRATDNAGLSIDTSFSVHVNAPPVISNFDGIPVIGDYWTFSGSVADPDDSVQGFVVTFGGVLASYNMTAVVQADGTFSTTDDLIGLRNGSATAQTQDSLGAVSNTAEFLVAV
jgi:autotransporter-associated beta strand protein